MLARRCRLRSTHDIERVYRRGSFGSAGPVQAKVYATRLAHNRVAIVVAKKVAKQATRRNRIRRRVSEFIRTRWETIPAPYDIVITVRDAAAADMPAAELQTQISTAMERAMRPGKGRVHV